MKLFTIFFIAVLAIFTPATAVFAQSFDHNYAAYDAQLKKHVKWLPDNKQSRVNYKGLAAERAELTKTLDSFQRRHPRTVRHVQQRAANGVFDQRLQRLHH